MEVWGKNRYGTPFTIADPSFETSDDDKILAWEASDILLETAHPAKFHETVEKQIPVNVEIPEQLKKSLAKDKISTEIGNKLGDLKQILMK